MPTYRHAWCIERALNSLLAQEFQAWELIVVNDASPDETAGVLQRYLTDSRIRYFESDRNEGLGHSLNFATSQSRGEYIAYLPSDDVYFAWHLRELVETLGADPEVYLAYGGVQCHRSITGWSGPTLRGSSAVGNELAALDNEIDCPGGLDLSNGNILALVQVLHRRSLVERAPWKTRSEYVSDRLEPDHWRLLLGLGAEFRYAGRTTCEWSDHPDQHHKIISEALDRQPPKFVPWARSGRGLSAYKTYYRIPDNKMLNWEPSNMDRVDEAYNYSRLTARSSASHDGHGLKILIVGSLSHNPERVLALEEAGHELFGLWLPCPEIWDQASVLPYGRVTTIPYDADWRDRVQEIGPDVGYALLNYGALSFIDEILSGGLDIPVVFHFKESPFSAMRYGLWEGLGRCLSRSDGHIFINEENYEWYRFHLGDALSGKPFMLLDGDLPKQDWMTSEWTDKLSDSDGEVHTICIGRPVGMESPDVYAAAGIHVHYYGEQYRYHYRAALQRQTRGGMVHLHPTISGTDWVRELSRYDAGWMHLFDSDNRGDLRAAGWNDLNLPARIGTYVSAGLPILMKDNLPSINAVRNKAEKYGIGISFRTVEELRRTLSQRGPMAEATERVRQSRHEFAFDTHVPRLVQFFNKLISG